MTDKTKTILKPIQSQFREARSLFRHKKISKSSLKPSFPKHPPPHGATSSPDLEKAAKSYAQVARMVAPNAGGPKPGDEIEPHSDDEIDWESIERDQQNERQKNDRAEELILRRILADEESGEPKSTRPKPKSERQPEQKPDLKFGRKLKKKPAAGGDHPKSEERPHPLGVRFSAVELEIVKAKARTVGCSVNSYIRAAAIGSNYRPPRDPELTKALLMVNRELTAQGNNLNQIARQLNAGIVTPAQAESMVEMLARSLLKTHKLVRQALGFGEPES